MIVEHICESVLGLRPFHRVAFLIRENGGGAEVGDGLSVMELGFRAVAGEFERLAGVAGREAGTGERGRFGMQRGGLGAAYLFSA
ncbi:MAG: hypothetical protein ABMA13_02625 [Chthoniobacteraceae bacterium]